MAVATGTVFIIYENPSSERKKPFGDRPYFRIFMRTITIPCLQQLYNAVGVIPSAPNNSIAVTGYLVSIYFDSIDTLADSIQGEVANIHDLQLFYANQRRDALGSKFTFVSANGNFT